jgi:hypothetical protein
VLEVQIAVTVDSTPLAAPALEAIAVLGDERTRPVARQRQVLGNAAVAPVVEHAQILLGGTRASLEPLLTRERSGRAESVHPVEARDQSGERVDLRSGERPLLEQRQRVAAVRKAAHHDAVFERRGIARERLGGRSDLRSRPSPAERCHAEVDIRCKAPVERHLAQAVCVAFRA